LLAAHRFTAHAWASRAAHQIFVDLGESPRNAIQNRADRIPFFGVNVVDSTGDKSQLLVYFFSRIGVTVLSGVLGGTLRANVGETEALSELQV